MVTFKRELLFERIVGEIEEQIVARRLLAGQPVLSLNQLAERYQVSKNSAVKAVATLCDRGLIERVHGKGNYVTDRALELIMEKRRSRPMRSASPRQLGLSFPGAPHYLPILSKIKDYALSHGALLTVFDVGENNQDPKRERLFLEKMAEAGVGGVGVFASPIDPVNTSLFNDLRRQGVKVALLSAYKSDMTDQVCFLPDMRQAGYAGVEYLRDRGVENVFITGVSSRNEYYKRIVEGVYTACRDNALAFATEAIRTCGAPWDQDWPIERLFARNSGLRERLGALPPKSGVICAGMLQSIIVRHWLRAGPGRDDVPLFSCGRNCRFDLPAADVVADTDDLAILTVLIDYLLDDAIPVDFIFQKYFRPKIVVEKEMVKGD